MKERNVFVNGVINDNIYKTECLLLSSSFYAICNKIFVAVEGHLVYSSRHMFKFTLCSYVQQSLVASGFGGVRLWWCQALVVSGFGGVSLCTYSCM